MDSENLEILQQLAPDWAGGDIQKLIDKFNGNLEKAADALLGGKSREELLPVVEHGTTSRTEGPDVIDLTGDDSEEITRALQMSMETNNVQTTPTVTFGPSNRVPDNDWAMTLPSSSQIDSNSKSFEDQQMEEAVKLSMQAFDTPEDRKDIPNIAYRDPSTETPLLIFAEKSKQQWAALVICAILYIPQVNDALRAIANGLKPSEISTSLAQLILHAAHQDHAEVGLLADQIIFGVYTKITPAHDIAGMRESARDLFVEILWDIQEHYAKLNHAEPLNLGQMQHQLVQIGSNDVQIEGAVQLAPATVRLNFGNSEMRDDFTDLIFNLIIQESENALTSITALRTPLSDVFNFELVNAGHCADAPVLAETIYLDKFMADNVGLMHEKLEIKRSMDRERAQLATRKQTLTMFNNQDTRKDLKTTLQYYESVAQGRDNPERRARIDGMADKLKSAITALDEELLEIEKETSRLWEDSQKVFDGPELKQHPYVLRSILVSAGPPGRSNLYSYMQDARKRWWKTVDTEVTEVPRDEVFGDSSGVLLGAGPFALLYSREAPQTEKQAWPSWLTDSIFKNNELYSQQESLNGQDIARDISMADLTTSSADLAV